ncbi:WD40 repeat domain-containing protein [Rhizobium ruizarguesonis]|uniref:WD40 repeat domain-containing protein n=1 Tax=Rhizobium ruizarguesonis TaxID=2081791 RepID=UPI001032282E|nr:hypothetical protein [Rhizobium ruizarguesonis]TBA29341.1 hypothetical protein ELH63_36960 [Rhizobium ruizarguesonis]TBA31378.1 hypothetical protein ELH62_32680 [Rhizobium ruizarguesonis]
MGKHDDWIRAIAFSPDGLKVASLSHDGTCRIHSTGSTSSSLPKPIGPTSYIAELAFSPSGNRLVSRADNGTLHLWDGAAGVPVACLAASNTVVLEGGDASPCLFVTDETIRSVASLAGVWDARTGRKLEDGGKSSFYPGCVLNWSPDGSRWCSYEPHSVRHEIQLFDPRKGLLASFSHNARIRCVAFAPDSQHVAYGAADGWLRVRVASTGKLLCEFRAHEAAIAQCAVSCDGTRLATIGADQQVVIWRWTDLLWTDGATGNQPREIRPEARLDVG